MKGNELINFREMCVNLIDSFFKCDFSNILNIILFEYLRYIFCCCSEVFISGYLCFNKSFECLMFLDLFLKKVCNFYNYMVIKILIFCVFNEII